MDNFGPFTYEEWKDEGYHVMKGEKYTGRNLNGQPTFTWEQVEEDDYTHLDAIEY